MVKQRFQIPVAVFGILQRNDQVLLGRRFQTGHEDGNYGLPSGHIDGDESLSQALIRELKEEIGVKVNANDLEFRLLSHRNGSDKEYIDVFFRVKNWNGEPRIMEPDKCDDLSWFDISHLPDNTIDYIRQVLEAIAAGQTFREIAW
jgi:mutator protein MutT